MKRIFINDIVHAQRLERLQARGDVTLDIFENPDEEVVSFPPERIRHAQIMMCAFPPENFGDMKALEFVQLSTAGYAQLFELNLPGRGIRACNALGIYDVPIAEWNVMMLVSLGRDLPGMLRNQAAHVWDRSAVFQRELRGSVVGIWGYGGIGRETARQCKAMGLNVHVLSKSGVAPRRSHYGVPGTGDPDGELPDRVFTLDGKDEFLGGLDFLVLAMPLTHSTRGIIGEHELRCLPKTACILNPARGHLIEEEPLVEALRTGAIAGAALDTHYCYPMPPDHPFWDMPNVILTPHISGSNDLPYFPERLWDLFVQNVERYLDGRPLLNELSAEKLRGD